MINRNEVVLIDRDALVEAIKRRFAENTQEIIDEIYSMPVTAVAVPHYEVKLYQ